jgi:hypothetical protein
MVKARFDIWAGSRLDSKGSFAFGFRLRAFDFAGISPVAFTKSLQKA